MGFFCFLFFLQLRKIVLKEKQKNYVQEEREYQDSLEYLDFDIDILFFGFYKTIVNSLEKKGAILWYTGVYIFNQSNKDLRNWIFLLKQLSLYIIEHPSITLIQEHHTKHIRIEFHTTEL